MPKPIDDMYKAWLARVFGNNTLLPDIMRLNQRDAPWTVKFLVPLFQGDENKIVILQVDEQLPKPNKSDLQIQSLTQQHASPGDSPEHARSNKSRNNRVQTGAGSG